MADLSRFYPLPEKPVNYFILVENDGRTWSWTETDREYKPDRGFPLSGQMFQELQWTFCFPLSLKKCFYLFFLTPWICCDVTTRECVHHPWHVHQLLLSRAGRALLQHFCELDSNFSTCLITCMTTIDKIWHLVFSPADCREDAHGGGAVLVLFPPCHGSFLRCLISPVEHLKVEPLKKRSAGICRPPDAVSFTLHACAVTHCSCFILKSEYFQTLKPF